MDKQYLKLDQYRRAQCDAACSSIEKEAKVKKSVGPSEDTVLRMEIHKVIQEMVCQGKSKLEIVTALYNQFSDSKLSAFFPEWVDHHIAKRMKQLAKKENDDEKER